MSNLFKKAAVATDVHLGAKSNSVLHNEDCLEFINWFVATAKEEQCETAILCGDWHNHRANLNIHTLNYSMQCLEILNSNFTDVYFLPGNHDLYFRENRSVTSVGWVGYLKNVHFINEIYKHGDVVLAPWLVGDDFKKLTKMSGQYLFSHLELPTFLMNGQIEMPDHGTLNSDQLNVFGTVFSGHFHKRQAKKNIWYIGNAFPHNSSDVGDDARGMMLLEWGKDPEFKSWPNQPVFRNYKLSDVLDNPDGLLLPKSSVKINLDITISYEEANFIRETLIPQYKMREMILIPNKHDHEQENNQSDGLVFESVDNIVIQQIQNIQSDFYDPKILMEVYRSL